MKWRRVAMSGAIVAVFAATVVPTLWPEAGPGHGGQAKVPVEGMMAGSGAVATAKDPARGSPGHDAAAVPDAPSTADDAAVPHSPGWSVESDEAGKAILARDPSWRAARLAELRALQVEANPGLVEELALTVEEAGLVFDTLANTRLAVEVEAALAAAPAPDQEELAAATGHRRQMQRRQGEVLHGLLGEQRYGQWQEYLQTRPVRQQASSHAAALARAGVPLDSGQVRILTRAMIAEQERLAKDILALGVAVDLSRPHTQLQAQRALEMRRAESSGNVLSATAPFLDAMQSEALRARLGQDGIGGAAAKP